LRSEKYVERLRNLRKHRERAELALDDGGWSELGGRPRAGVGADGLEDDDAMSEAPSLASDMSAYTDRTGLTSVVSGTSAASTIGGRKGKKRKDKKNKNNRSGLRAGSPTEERDLALHVIALAPVNKTLEEIGELLELLVSLGHEDDARALQRVVSEAVDAASRAKVDAETSLGELIERAKKAGESVEAFEKHASAFDATPEWKWSLLRAATGSSE
jgi:elongator complex protein 1